MLEAKGRQMLYAAGFAYRTTGSCIKWALRRLKMNDLNTVLIIVGSIFLILGGSMSVLLISANNGITYALTDTGYGLLFLSIGAGLTGFVLLLIGVTTNRNEKPKQQIIQPPPVEPIFYCKVCGVRVGLNQTFCGNCGRVLEWGKQK